MSLVTSGPYRYVRHPFYTSYLIFWTGLALGTWSLWAVPVLIVMLVLYAVAARSEEGKFSRTEMSADYAAYRARTGMFWPKLWLDPRTGCETKRAGTRPAFKFIR